MSRLRRIFLLPALAVSAALLIAAPASALPSFAGAESAWARLLEPLLRLGGLFATQGWSIDPGGRPAPPSTEDVGPSGLFAPEGWLIDSNGRVAPPLSNQGWDLDPNGRVAPPPAESGWSIDPNG